MFSGSEAQRKSSQEIGNMMASLKPGESLFGPDKNTSEVPSKSKLTAAVASDPIFGRRGKKKLEEAQKKEQEEKEKERLFLEKKNKEADEILKNNPNALSSGLTGNSTNASSTAGGSLFGSSTPVNNTSTPSTNNQSSSTNLFGSSSLTGNNASSTSGGLFGNSITTNSSLGNSTMLGNNSSSNSIFGNNNTGVGSGNNNGLGSLLGNSNAGLSMPSIQIPNQNQTNAETLQLINAFAPIIFALNTSSLTYRKVKRYPTLGPQNEIMKDGDLPEQHMKEIARIQQKVAATEKRLQDVEDAKIPGLEKLDTVGARMSKSLQSVANELMSKEPIVKELVSKSKLALRQAEKVLHEVRRVNNNYNLSNAAQNQNGLPASRNGRFIVSKHLPSDFFMEVSDKLEKSIAQCQDNLKSLQKSVRQAMDSAYLRDTGGLEMLKRMMRAQTEMFMQVAEEVGKTHKKMNVLRRKHISLFGDDFMKFEKAEKNRRLKREAALQHSMVVDVQKTSETPQLQNSTGASTSVMTAGATQVAQNPGQAQNSLFGNTTTANPTSTSSSLFGTPGSSSGTSGSLFGASSATSGNTNFGQVQQPSKKGLFS